MNQHQPTLFQKKMNPCFKKMVGFKKITFLGMDQIREAAVGQGGLGHFNRFRKHVFLQSAVFGRDAGAAPNGFQHCALPVMVEGGGT